MVEKMFKKEILKKYQDQKIFDYYLYFIHLSSFKKSIQLFNDFLIYLIDLHLFHYQLNLLNHFFLNLINNLILIK